MKLLKNIKIRSKLFIIIIISALALSIVGIQGIRGLSKISKGSEIIYQEQLIPNQLFATLRANNLELDTYNFELMVTKDNSRNETLQKNIDEKNEENTAVMEEIDQLNLAGSLSEKYESFKSEYTELQNIGKQMRSLAMDNKNKEAYDVYLKDMEPQREAVSHLIEEIQTLNSESAKTIYQQDSKEAGSIIMLLIIVMAASLVLSVSIGLLMTRLIAKPIKDIQALFAQTEQGDFTVEGTYQSKDELGLLTASFNKMVTGVHAIIETVGETSHQVASSSQQLSASADESTKASEYISTTIQELAAGSEQQADSVENSRTVIKGMTEFAGRISSNAEKAAATADQTAQMSLEGTKAINKVSVQMQSINETVVSLSEAFKHLTERSNEIGNITEVITSIAEQTNLLALNAAIEAARAGEQGKGFAVVADEVRTLAEQSARSAEQITKLIAIIQNDTKQTMNTVISATGEVKEGLVVVNEAGGAFHKIENSITEVVTQINDVTNLVKNLTAGTSEIETAITGVKEVAETAAESTQTVSAATQEQLASMEEIAAASQILAQNAEELQHLIQKFKIKA
ncbi:HAMP domain-containing methyl-accepting chemotaxis protein [Bacillus swezeyi]|uniref:Methyl-accepting chemotaxis protein n=1 Tax=Bacillus swezeyi TaxID=1925020 RepID=A0A1R1QJV0_9BACI|nr:HAMP domain-containing methyl-accepting chemotaxis protein [Bacillus swezeyi]MEC1260678.1 HAMP domain-containing methyl-accepting chemotaxis protein [Bacillus swezeyi]MED2928371.1 HAMP domain-containing methyl-accepting chemotaxis protein [Bacillus swezeyi]MED2963998.1 HAMP domain-containing methyl-accepting chemotaxis protein [Bacillus swezeyi]MED3074129.1 HAMP domain-containing methyl-accepting chemotaxis protein [Bacillus swezeyi]MED3083882.1 HAMP domain-containing methyl-accepting chemo